MSEDREEIISALADGEAVPGPEVLERLERDAEALRRWSHYHLIRSVLHGERPLPLGRGFNDRLHEALRAEPALLVPAVRRRHLVRRLAAVGRQAAGMAVAASVAVAAVLLVQRNREADAPAVVAQSQAPAAALRQVATARSDRLSQAVERKLSGYLVNHNQYSAGFGVQGIPAYARIVSITPGERVADER